ncbi:cation transporter [Purpureocillium lilacinum]|uniref:Potassium transport protein n=1 Tax=Purpureocillium lilacinum TaxID=33203 RepID=A0A179FL27_PURLI|nr:cation transporter [Purpureocillium lilacinum]
MLCWRPRWRNDWLEEHPNIDTVVTHLRAYLPPLNFITLHYAYFILVCLVTSVIFWGSSRPAYSVSYVDSLFMTVSAMTEAGLNTVNLSQMNTWQQVLLFLLIMFGSSIWVSIWTVATRLHVFENRFEAIVQAERERDRDLRLRRRGSATSLPLFKRVAAFRKTLTSPPGDPTLPGIGSRIPQKTSYGDAAADLPHLSWSGQQRTASLPELENTERHKHPNLSTQSSPSAVAMAERRAFTTAHIAFADRPHPRSGDNVNTTTTLRAQERQNEPVRRDGAPNAAETDHQKITTKSWHMHDFLANKTVGRNTQFPDLSTEEREHLGGCEYRALRILVVIVPLYFLLWQFLGCVALGAWIANYQPETARQNGIDPWWLGIFNGVSAFNNSGMSLLDANMIPFQRAYFVLITMSLMILAGNTAYPIFLRLIIWAILKVLRVATDDETSCDLKSTLEFILKYPRRVYTNLFPSRPTWWLLFMLICLNSIDWAAFELMNFGNPAVESIPLGARTLDGLFQAFAVRSGGFYVVPISSLYIGVQLLYVIMMYISVYPVTVTMRHSNIYEERSLGIYADEPEVESDAEETMQLPNRDRLSSRSPLVRRISRSSTAVSVSQAIKRSFIPWHGVGVPPQRKTRGGGASVSRISFISQQIHGQLAHDIWWLVLAVLVITTIETSQFLADPVTNSVFNIIFEVVSAYGCVGISVGLPNQAYSFSGSWHLSSKLVLCLVMLRGRHRGLPVALDRAVRLPAEQMHRDEEEDYRIRKTMTRSRMSVGLRDS